MKARILTWNFKKKTIFFSQFILFCSFEMIKSKEDFDLRNKKKQEIHNSGNKIFVGIREIRYVSLWNNIGYEEDWKWDDFLRPVLVISKVGNMFNIVPLTTKWKNWNRYYHMIKSIDFNKPSYVILSQSKTIDKKRFVRLLDKNKKISLSEFREIQKKLKDLYLPII